MIWDYFKRNVWNNFRVSQWAIDSSVGQTERKESFEDKGLYKRVKQNQEWVHKKAQHLSYKTKAEEMIALCFEI